MIKGLLLIHAALVIGADYHRERLLVDGYDFQNEYYTSSIHKVDLNKQYVAMSANEPQGVYLYTKDLVFVREIGKKGEGPSEIGTHTIPSFSLAHDEIWIIDSNQKYIKGFSLNGNHLKNIRIKRYIPSSIQPGTNSFIVEKNYLLVPTLNDKTIGYKYSKQTGEVIGSFDYPLEQEKGIYQNAPWYYNSSWFKDGDFLYVAFPHQPLILKLDIDLKLVDIFHIETPRAIEMHAEMYGKCLNREGSRMPMGMPIVMDIRITNDKIYVLLPFSLVALNKQTGNIEDYYTFYGKEKDVGSEASGMDLAFTSFYYPTSRFKTSAFQADSF